MESKVLDIELAKDGLDLYFTDKNTAVQFLSFLQAVVPMRTKTSRKLVSEDRQNNVHRSQWSMAVEIVPLCKDDLVLLLPGGGGGEGGLQGFVLVSRVTSVVHLLDVSTLRRAEVSAVRYFQRPLECVMSSKDLISYEVLDVELVGGREGGRGGAGGGLQQQQQQQQQTTASAKWRLAEVEVVKVGRADGREGGGEGGRMGFSLLGNLFLQLVGRREGGREGGRGRDSSSIVTF